MANECAAIDINAVKSRMVVVRNQPVLLAQDVASIYNVETRVVAQAVKNNPSKFPEGYVFDLTKDEIQSLKSKILTLDASPGRGHYSKRGYKAITEKGLYMLATILKGEVATKAALTIIETFAQVRQIKRDVLALHSEKDKLKQKSIIKRFGEALVDIVMPNEESTETESSIELNFVVAKLKHTVRKIRKAK